MAVTTNTTAQANFPFADTHQQLRLPAMGRQAAGKQDNMSSTLLTD